MAKEPTTPRNRTRKNRVETPGADAAPMAPVTSAAVGQVIAESNALKELQEVEKDHIEVIEVLQDEQVVRYAGQRATQLGDTWAGMVLTENGWMNPDHVNKE